MHKLKVLICDDMEHVRIAHEDALVVCGKGLFHPIIEEAESGEKAIAAAQEANRLGSGFDLVLMDIDFGQNSGNGAISGFEAIDQIHKLIPNAVFAIISSYGTDDNYLLASQAKVIERFFRRGSFDLGELKNLCKFALIRSLHSKNALLSPEKVAFTQAEVMRDYLKKIDQISEKDSVFVCGETGTGKELTAQRLNANAKVLTGNVNRPLITLNCGSIAPTLLMGEIFGHARGAFTGADRDREGWLERAHGGDIFLDELQNATSEFQQALLVFLQTGEFSRVGETRVRKIDARVIVAFNEDPIAAIRSGKLREDLFGRLQKNFVVIPPLRERKGDVPALIAHFQCMHGKADKVFSPEAMQFLETLPWRTNVREVKAVVEAAIDQSKLPVITRENLQELPLVKKILAEMKTSEVATHEATLKSCSMESWEEQAIRLFNDALKSGLNFYDILAAFEKTALKGSLKSGEAFLRLAKKLGIPESTLRRKLDQFNLISEKKSHGQRQMVTQNR